MKAKALKYSVAIFITVLLLLLKNCSNKNKEDRYGHLQYVSTGVDGWRSGERKAEKEGEKKEETKKWIIMLRLDSYSLSQNFNQTFFSR